VSELPIGTVVSVNISERKTVRKTPGNEGTLIFDRGLEGDAHAGDWHRQVSLLAQESIDKMVAAGLDVGKAFGMVVTILVTILANIVGDLPTYYLTKADNDASAHRQEVVARQTTVDILRAVGPKHFVTITNVNVRERPERKAKLIRKLPAGILLAELDRDARGWRYVQSVKADVAFEGWVYYQNIKPKR